MKKYVLFILLSTIITFDGFSQVEENEEVFTIVENMPEFPGGKEELFKYIADNINYPEIAKKNHIEGTVYINFVVSKSGKIVDVKVLRGVHPALNKESLRVVKSMPKWNAGTHRGKAVSVSYNLPIRFYLNDKKLKKKKKK